jgi:cholesterol transport system auxiliary component
MNRFPKRTRLALLVGLMVIAGCASLTKPYPGKNLYAISVGDPPATSAASGHGTLRVAVVRLAQPYDSLTFVYKIGDSKFTSDYYNGFIAPPDRMLTGELISWLSKSGLYSAVIGGGNSADSHLSIETEVSALYGDYSDPKSPSATLTARFFLIDSSGSSYRIVFQKLYTQTEPMANASPDELVKAWERAYRGILGSLVDDLKQLPAAESTAVAQ